MTLERNWRKLIRRLLTLSGLIVITFSSTGCQGMRGCCGVPVFNARICPTCNARTVQECRCFTAYDNAGYTETCWTSLAPTCCGDSGPSDYVPNDYVPNDYVPNDYVPNDYGPENLQGQETIPLPQAQPSPIRLGRQSEVDSSVRTISDVIPASHDDYFRP